MVWPCAKWPVWLLVRPSTGAGRIVVGSLAVGEFVAPPPLALALLVSDPAALAATSTVRVMALVPPLAAMAVLLVQVTVGELAPEQIQSPPLAEAKVKPVGKVSVTVSSPLVASVPILLTVSV